jgi:hypothetical protein
MSKPENQLRLGQILEMDTLGVGYLRDVQKPLREYLFAERQVVKLPEGPAEITVDSMVWYQTNSVGQVDFIVPASGLAGLTHAVLSLQDATTPVATTEWEPIPVEH